MTTVKKNGIMPVLSDAQASLIKLISEKELKSLTKDELESFLTGSKSFLGELQSVDSLDFTIKSSVEKLINLPSDLGSLTKEEMIEYATLLVRIAKQVNSSSILVTDVKALNQSTLGQELNNIDFNILIGGPLQAVVQAQGASALSTIEFIKEVGFEKDSNGAITGIRKVDFMYDKKTGERDVNGEEKTIATKISVPLLSMINVPTLRIQDVDIAFNAKLNGIETKEVKTDLQIKAELGINYKFINFKVSGSYQRSTTQGSKVEREYTLGVKVKATQDEIPAGLEKIFNLLAA